MPVNKDFYTLAGSSGQSTGYEIANSLRFNDNDSGFLLDAGTDAGDTRKKNTWSLWVKRGNISSAQYIAAYRYDATNYQYLLFKASDQFEFTDVTGGSVQSKIVTAREFRDPSAWYHIVCVWDTADGVAGNRARVYVNGVRETSLNTGTYPSQNADSGGAGRADARIRIGTYDASGQYFDGYLAEIHYTDNYAYDPPNFGEFKEDTDIWIPKEFTGSYGSAGAYLDFETSGTLGANSKGKGNFSTSGISADDQFIDTPTNNFVVISSIANRLLTFANGNMEVNPTSSTSAHKMAKTTMGIPTSATGKYYWEFQVPSSLGAAAVDMIGMCDLDAASNTESSTLSTGSGYGFGYRIGVGNTYLGSGWTNNGFTSSGFVASNYYGFAYDASTGKLYIYQNGSALNSGNHVATFDKRATLAPGVSIYNYTTVYKFFNGAQASLTNSNFNYAPQAGYVPINSINLGSEF